MVRHAIVKANELVSLPRRHTVAFLTFCAVAIFVSIQVLLTRIPRFTQRAFPTLQSLSNGATQASTETSVQDDIPPLLSPVITQPSGPVHPFTVPTVLTYYEDILPKNYTKLYLITSGIEMPPSKRDFKAVACQVGDDIYPASVFVEEVLHCEVPRLVRRGERLVAVLAWNDRLKRATEGPVELVTGIVAELFPGDIEKLPDSAILRGKLASANRDNFRVARSDVHVGASDNFVAKDAKYHPRYRLCLMTMVAPNSHMLKDWADYHRRIGVDQVYIFDNGAKLDLAKMFENRKDVEIIPWPYHKSQLQAFSMALISTRARCERIMMEDSDEYAMFGLGEGTSWRTRDPPLIRYAKKLEKKGFLNYKLTYIVMVNSGFLHRPKGEVPTNYIHRCKNQLFDNGKSVCYTDLEWQCGAIHYCGRVNGSMPRLFSEKIRNWGELKMTPEDPDDPPFLIHFRDRSWEEYIEKWDAGRVSGKGVADLMAGTLSMDNPGKHYLTVDSSREYTHFRDYIYTRVLKEGTLNEQTIVQTIDGRRCERLYKIDKSPRELVHEICL